MVHASTMVNAAVPRDVPTTLSFISPSSNFNIRFIAPSAEVNTGVYEEHNVVIKDARPNRSSFTLDTGGFVLADHKSNVEPSSIYVDFRFRTIIAWKATSLGKEIWMTFIPQKSESSSSG
jgi:hypothetical protein